MSTIDTTLLDLDRAPTLDELKAFFKKHDWSAAEIQIDGKKNQETVKDIAYIKKLLDEKFEKAARDKGLPAWSGYYENKINPSGNASHQGNSLLELRDNTEKLISNAVFNYTQNDALLDMALSAVDFSDPNWQEKADELCANAVNLMLDTMQYREIAELFADEPAHEDFNQFKHPNYKKEDFLREWDHLRSKFGTLPDPDLELKAIDRNPGTEAKAIANIMAEEYWKTIDEKDKIIIKMIEAGYTQNEIATHLGMANNSGVSKRIAKLQKDFERKTGIKISKD